MKQKGTFMVAAMGVNALMGAITGFEPLPDFLGAALDTGGDLLDDEDERNVGEKLLGGGQRMLGEYASMNPVISATVNAFTTQDMRKKIFGSESDLGRFEGTAAPVQVVRNVYDATQAAIQGNWTEARNKVLRVIPYGNQARKSITGVEANQRGYAVDKSGNPTYATSDNVLQKIKNVLFGPSADPNARKYYENSGRALSDTQAETLKTLGKNEQLDYLKSITETRAANRQTDKELAKLEKGTSTETKQLSTGKIAYKSLDGTWKTAKDQKTADQAIVNEKNKQLLDEFDDSGKNFEVKDGLVYRRKEDGKPYTTPQGQFESQVRTQQMESYKDNKDINGWLTVAEEQVKSLLMELNNTEDPLVKITLENDIRGLMENISKYSGYGGFTKPKTTSTRSTSSKSAKSVARMDYAKGLESNYTDMVKNQNAVRNLLKGINIKRRKL